jgi:hypothetical protein
MRLNPQRCCHSPDSTAFLKLRWKSGVFLKLHWIPSHILGTASHRVSHGMAESRLKLRWKSQDRQSAGEHRHRRQPASSCWIVDVNSWTTATATTRRTMTWSSDAIHTGDGARVPSPDLNLSIRADQQSRPTCCKNRRKR